MSCSDVLLPANAKVLGFVDNKQSFNPDYDIVWSFEYSIQNPSQFGFVTFLTTGAPISACGGHYLGYRDGSKGGPDQFIVTDEDDFLITDDGDFFITGEYNDSSAQFITDSEGNYILDDDGNYIVTGVGAGFNGVFSIAFDSTGYYALSTATRDGIHPNDAIPNSMIIRDEADSLIFNQALSSIDSNFFFDEQNGSDIREYKVLRFKYTNGNKITIDYKQLNEPVSGDLVKNPSFQPLTSVTIDNSIIKGLPYLYPGFSLSSPVSSTDAPGTIRLRNFHTQGYTGSTKVETTEFKKLTSYDPDVFNTINI